MSKLIKALAVFTAAAAAASSITVPVSASSIPAFPGAEGGGMYSTGARDASSPEIYHVTNLNDSGKGSFRDAVSESNRIIVFDVAGNIELVNALSIIGDNLTILGQTAPGDGICIKNNTVGIYGDNIILRYMRFRMGDSLTVEYDSIGGRGLKNVILDHCSMSWSVDECASFYENTNFTMQWCIVSESLKESVHGKGSHGYAGIWGGENASFHHNLIAHHDSRNPRIATAGIEAAMNDVTKQTDLTDLRNNVVYNWGGNSAYGGENGAPVNLINCYYKPGPSTDKGKTKRLFQISAKKEGDTTGTNNLNCPGWGTDLYVSGNYVFGNAKVTSDNTKGVDFDSNTTTYGLWTDKNITEDEKTVHNRYISDYPITTDTAEEAYNKVLSSAGASISRDSIDTSVINDVKNGTGSLINTPSDAGGYPELNGTKAKDSDNDGIPNEWEDMHGLNKFDKNDALTLDSSGYTMLEMYANSLANGSYTRNVNYDPDIDDYIPDAEETDKPQTSAEPEKKLINEWTASAEDVSKKAGDEFMPGLRGMIDFNTSKTDTVTFDDGSVYSFAITSKTSAGWNGTAAKGNALKYKAPQDGIFTLYGYSVSGEKTFYAVSDGVSDLKNDCIYSKVYIGTSVPIKYTQEVKKDNTYYFFIDGSKMRFCAAKLEEYIQPEPSASPAPSEQPSIAIADIKKSDNDLNVIFNTSNIPSGTQLIVSGYKDGRLSYASLTGSNSAVLPADTDIVKVFAWNSINGMIPICERALSVVK